MENHQLPSYKKARDLVKQLSESTQKVPRTVKYTTVAEMINSALDIMVDIADANEENFGTREEFLKSALKRLSRIRIQVRCLYDLHYITKKGLNSISGYEGNLESQLKGWLANPYGDESTTGKRKVMNAGASTVLRKVVTG